MHQYACHEGKRRGHGRRAQAGAPARRRRSRGGCESQEGELRCQYEGSGRRCESLLSVITMAGAGLGLWLAAAPAAAHHAFAAEFDINQPVTLKGTITKMEWNQSSRLDAYGCQNPGWKNRGVGRF